MFRQLTLKANKDEGLVQFLLDRPHLLTYTRVLDLRTYSPEKDYVAPQESFERSRYLLVGCSRLDTLRLAESSSLWYFALRGSYASRLTSLSLTVAGRSFLQISKLTTTLLRCRSLNHLDIAIDIGIAQDFALSPSAAQLRLTSLRLKVATMAHTPQLSAARTSSFLALTNIIALSTLRRCVLAEWTGEREILDWLRGCNALEDLVIRPYTYEETQAYLPDIIAILPSLTSLQNLEIGSDPDPGGVVSPLRLFDVLSALPLSLVFGSLTDIAFEDYTGIPALALQPGEDKPVGPTFEVQIAVEGMDFELVEVVLLSAADGTSQWTLIEVRSFCFPLLSFSLLPHLFCPSPVSPFSFPILTHALPP